MEGEAEWKGENRGENGGLQQHVKCLSPSDPQELTERRVRPRSVPSPTSDPERDTGACLYSPLPVLVTLPLPPISFQYPYY